MVPIPPFLSKFPKHKEFRRLIKFIEENNYQSKLDKYSNVNGYVSFSYTFPGDETYMFDIMLESKYYKIIPIFEHDNISAEIKKRYADLSISDYGIDEKKRVAEAEQRLFNRIKKSLC